jgi:hypothetical protein
LERDAIMKGRLNPTEGAAHVDRYYLGEWINYKMSTETCQNKIEANNKITFDSIEEFVHWANSLGYHRSSFNSEAPGKQGD